MIPGPHVVTPAEDFESCEAPDWILAAAGMTGNEVLSLVVEVEHLSVPGKSMDTCGSGFALTT